MRGVSTFDGSFANPRARLLESPRMMPRLIARPSRASPADSAGTITVSSAAGGPKRSPSVLVHAERGENEPFGHRLDGVHHIERAANDERHAGNPLTARHQRGGSGDFAQTFEVEVRQFPGANDHDAPGAESARGDDGQERLVQPPVDFAGFDGSADVAVGRRVHPLQLGSRFAVEAGRPEGRYRTRKPPTPIV